MREKKTFSPETHGGVNAKTRQDKTRLPDSQLLFLTRSFFRFRFAIFVVFALCVTANAFSQTSGSSKRSIDAGVFDINGGKTSCCAAEPDGKSFSPLNSAEYETYRLTATYYSLRDNLTTTLMLNNKGPQPILATPTIYSLSGTRLQLAPITVGATSYLDVDMHELLSGTADEFREGSMKIAYSGIMTQLGAQIKMVDPERGLIWAEQFAYTTKFTSSRLESVWWMPYDDSKARVVVSNTSANTITATITVDGTAPQQSEPAVMTLAPWETRVLDIMGDLIGHPNGHVKEKGGVSIVHTASPGALLARMFIAKPNKGYSAANGFIDPESTASQRWHGNGIRFRNLDGAKTEPILAVRNTGAWLSRVKGRIIYTRPNGDTSIINLPEKPIPPNSTKVFNLENVIDSANIPNAVKYGGIELEYDTAKGTILTSVQSVSQNGEHVFQVPMFDPQNMPSSAGGFPWKADGDFRTLVYIKNETDTLRKFTADLFFPGGGSYGTGLKEIKPGQTITIDFREIRDQQTPDRMGTIIPLGIQHGQIAWSAKGAESKTLSARSEQISVSEGIASTYSCGNCCEDSYYDGILIPYDALEEIGGLVPFRAMQEDSTCLGTHRTPYEVFADWWDSTDLAVAEVDSIGDTTALGAGTSYIQAGWSAVTWSQVEVGQPCIFVLVPGGGESPVDVVAIQKIQYKGPNNETFSDSANPLYVLKGTPITFKAIPNPETATFPSGKPVWSGSSGATGTGPTTSVTFNTVSSSSTNYKTVVATSGNSVVTVNVVVYELTAVLTPQDMFDTNRSKIKFGLLEVVALGFTANPAVTASQAGDLEWSRDPQIGSLDSQNDGTGEFIAPTTAGSTTLKLEVLNGPSKGQHVSQAISVVAPSGARFVKTSNIQHTQGLFGGCLRGYIYLDPKDVSFKEISFREGSCPPSVSSGYFSPSFNNFEHPATPVLIPLGNCSMADGCRTSVHDEVCTGRPAPATPYRDGTFVWIIPWMYYTSTLTTSGVTFTTASQTYVSDDTGSCQITKKDAGPFTVNVNDPTSGF